MNALSTTTNQDPMALCQAIAVSGLSGAKTKESAFALACMALAEDPKAAENPLAFMAALGRASTNYHIVNGRPTMKSEIMLARFQQAGGKVEWSQYDDKRVCGTFYHPSGGTISVDWTIERAKAAGLTGKPGPWQSHPRAMLRSRVIVEAIRTIYPAVLNGTMEPDEAMEATPVAVISSGPAVHDTGAEARAAFVRLAAKDKPKADELHKASGGNPHEFVRLVEEYEASKIPTPNPPQTDETTPVVVLDESVTP